MDDGTFEAFHISNIPVGTRVIKLLFVDEIKTKDKGLRLKFRLIGQNYCDEDSASIAKKYPTKQRFPQRPMMSVAAYKEEMCLYTRDITQAYFQSRKKLERLV